MQNNTCHTQKQKARTIL